MPTLTPELTDFINRNNAIFAEAKARATALPVNTVQVWPGGATFSTIQSAINSITNASKTVQYQVAVGPGSYHETVVMKDHVFMVGVETGITVIYPGVNVANPTVTSASGCGISNMTIDANGGPQAPTPIAIKINGTGDFHINGVNIVASDAQNPCHVSAISNINGSTTGNVILSQSNIQAANTTLSTGTCIELSGSGGNFKMFINLTQVNGIGYNTNGVTTAAGATATVDSSNISATQWALNDTDGASLITANHCTIKGSVSSGVIVNP